MNNIETLWLLGNLVSNNFNAKFWWAACYWLYLYTLPYTSLICYCQLVVDFSKSWKLLEICLLIHCNKSNIAYTSTLYFNIAGVDDFGSKPNKFASGTCRKWDVLVFGAKTAITTSSFVIWMIYRKPGATYGQPTNLNNKRSFPLDRSKNFHKIIDNEGVALFDNKNNIYTM